jgi:sterol desaturase/sphingolipid hydroxylase (fatty acid hydroxylase superfamily)
MLHFSKTEVITTTILVFSVFTFILLERFLPYRKGIKFFREGFWIDLVWYTLIQSYFLKIVIFDYIITPVDHHYHLSRLHLVTNWPLWTQVLFFFVTHDLYIYWFHRAQHHSKILWRIHEAHHSGKEVDWLAGSRSHVLEIIINQTIEFAPIVLLGANPLVVPIKALMDAVYGMFIHSNINVSLGKLKYFFNGPEMHQWHHADNVAVFYMNYSTKLSFWDWLFGTIYLPPHKPKVYGLYYEYPDDYFVQHVFSFKRFNFHKLDNNSLFRWYHYCRKNIIGAFKSNGNDRKEELSQTKQSSY